MKLYFETQAQLALFLVTCAMGFAMGLIPDVLSLFLGGRLRAVCDVVGFLLGFGALTAYLLLFSQSSVRLYDFLGLAVGLTLYALGLRRLVEMLVGRVKRGFRQRKSEKIDHSAQAKQEST